MSEEKLYRCIPELNKECKKNNCYINGGYCEMTICKEYSLKGLLEEIERLNNIINELSKENQELKEKTKLFHKNRVFSLEYDKETLRDMVLEYQERIDKAIEYIETHQLNFKKGTTTFGSERLSIEERKLLDILKGE